jgi:hypothetical protein
MLRLLLDENFHHDILRGLRRQLPEADLLTVQEAGLRGLSDPELLTWASGAAAHSGHTRPEDDPEIRIRTPGRR